MKYLLIIDSYLSYINIEFIDFIDYYSIIILVLPPYIIYYL